VWHIRAGRTVLSLLPTAATGLCGRPHLPSDAATHALLSHTELSTSRWLACPGRLALRLSAGNSLAGRCVSATWCCVCGHRPWS